MITEPMIETQRIALFMHPDHRDTLRDTRCRYEMHRTMRRIVPASAEDGDSSWRLLYRISGGGAGAPWFVWVQAASDALSGAAARLPGHMEIITRPRTVVCSYPVGTVLSFDLLSHPVIRSGREGERFLPREAWADYMERLASANGFRVERACHTEDAPVHAKNGRRLRAVRHTGILTVTDTDLFARAVRCGIGRGRAWGFGLLTLNSESPL